MRAQQYFDSLAVVGIVLGSDFGFVGIVVLGQDLIGIVVLVQGSIGIEVLVVG